MEEDEGMATDVVRNAENPIPISFLKYDLFFFFFFWYNGKLGDVFFVLR